MDSDGLAATDDHQRWRSSAINVLFTSLCLFVLAAMPVLFIKVPPFNIASCLPHRRFVLSSAKPMSMRLPNRAAVIDGIVPCSEFIAPCRIVLRPVSVPAREPIVLFNLKNSRLSAGMPIGSQAQG